MLLNTVWQVRVKGFPPCQGDSRVKVCGFSVVFGKLGLKNSSFWIGFGKLRLTAPLHCPGSFSVKV